MPPKIEELRDERESAHLAAYQLIYELQSGDDTAYARLRALGAEAETRGWSECARVGLLGAAIDAWLHRNDGVEAIVESFVESAEHSGDRAMLAAALALRSDGGFVAKHAWAGGGDLARAVVLLEQSEDHTLERVTGHTACGIALYNRSMFELADEQYRLALALGEKEPAGTIDILLAPIMFNLAELDVAWACALRQLGDEEGLAARWRNWNAAAGGTRAYEMPELWQIELEALGVLMAALAGYAQPGAAALQLDSLPDPKGAGARPCVILLLAHALERAASRAPDAPAAAEAAIAALDPDQQPHFFEVALFLAAEIEARTSEGAGLRFGRRHQHQRWARRLEALGAMEAGIAAERLSAEHEILSAHALRDDLTGIGNRRALERYLSAFTDHGGQRVALIIFDIDGFKDVNDRYGHLTGDAVLVAITEILQAGIRASDLAVRLGGDELAVLLGDTSLEIALERARVLLAAIDELAVACAEESIRITLSAGVASGDPALLSELWAEADAAMYRAKAGRGRAVGRSRVAAG